MTEPQRFIGTPHGFPLTLKSGEWATDAVVRVQKILREGRHLPDVEVYEMAEWMAEVLAWRNLACTSSGGTEGTPAKE